MVVWMVVVWGDGVVVVCGCAVRAHLQVLELQFVHDLHQRLPLIRGGVGEEAVHVGMWEKKRSECRREEGAVAVAVEGCCSEGG